MTLYVDLDSVLVDFVKAMSDLVGYQITPDMDLGKRDDVWKMVDEAGAPFWAKMEWMSDGRKLWDAIKDKNPTVLSAPSRHHTSREGKKQWVRENLGSDVPVILDMNKGKHCKPGFASGVNLYFLMAHRDQLLAMIRQKKSMYNLLSESADIQYKVSVLNSIAARTKDPSVKKEIEERIKLMQKALDEDIVKKKKRAEEAEKEAQEVSLEADKTRKEVPILQEAIEESGLTDAKQEGVPEGMPKQASYRNDPNFDLTVFYGSVLQAKIADMTARQLIINQSK